MKFFSSFDTKLKRKYIQKLTLQHGEENIVLITRSNLYFLKKVIVHIMIGSIAMIVIILGSYYINTDYISYSIRIALLVAAPSFILSAENYIDYTMNYAIFTPHEAILVEQLGFFKRNIKSLDTKKIKSIEIKKTSFIYSLFNDGVITIFNEGGASHGAGELVFKYVNNPEKTKDRIQKIIQS